jgi:hypothetical protein
VVENKEKCGEEDEIARGCDNLEDYKEVKQKTSK